MLDLLLDPATGDLDLSGSTLNLTSDRVTVVAQRLDGAISLQLGDWFLDLNKGIDWDGLLDQKDLAPILRAVTATVEADVDIESSELAIERAGRSARVTGTAKLTTGEIIPLDVTAP